MGQFGSKGGLLLANPPQEEVGANKVRYVHAFPGLYIFILKEIFFKAIFSWLGYLGIKHYTQLHAQTPTLFDTL